MSLTEGYFLSQDQDCHWYVVPKSKQHEWYKWLELDPDREESWDVPDYAVSVGGSPSLVTFYKYTV